MSVESLLPMSQTHSVKNVLTLQMNLHYTYGFIHFGKVYFLLCISFCMYSYHIILGLPVLSHTSAALLMLQLQWFIHRLHGFQLTSTHINAAFLWDHYNLTVLVSPSISSAIHCYNKQTGHSEIVNVKLVVCFVPISCFIL